MGELRNCRRCGKLFVYTGSPYCRQCLDEDEEVFLKVKEYIEKRPKCTMMDVSKDLGVPTDKILQFLREGKLELSKENVNMLLACERCGRSIFTGRYCKECAVEMERQFVRRIRTSATGDAKRVPSKMYTANRRKKD